MLIEIFSIIAPVFLCAVVGYVWVRSGGDFDTGFVSRLVTNIGAPCLIFATFTSIEIARDAFMRMMGAAVLTTLLFTLTGYLVLRVLRLDQRAFLPSQMFPNGGNMGLPLCLLAFGDEGLALGLTWFTINAVFGFTAGMSISSGDLSFRGVLRNPMLYAVIVSITMVFLELKPPVWLFNTTELLGGLMIPLMLISLGVSLASFRITSLKLSVGLSLLRLGTGFCVGLLIATLLGLEGAAKGVLILQCSMPVAVFTYLFAVRYDRRPAEVAGTVVISTLISFMSLPLLLWYVLP